jgi:hypothetical protein
VFHTANAYELDDGSVVVGALVYQRVFDRSRQGLETSQTRLERWRLDVERGRVDVCPWASTGTGSRMPCDANSAQTLSLTSTRAVIKAPRTLSRALS